MQTTVAQSTFARKEQKYLLETSDLARLMHLLGAHLKPSAFGHALVASLYYDTPTFELISRSLEKPLYKEKLRLRAYADCTGAAQPHFDEEGPVFVELKKKFDGIVYKRRVPMSEQGAFDFMEGSSFEQAEALLPLASLQQAARTGTDWQIAHELEATIGRYPSLVPTMMVVVERLAYDALDDSSLRITFDINPRYRTDQLTFDEGFAGNLILPNGQVIMEVKCASAYPRWLIDALNALELYPQPCSKYGRAFQLAHTAA